MANNRYDIPNDNLVDLIVFVLNQDGRLSNNRRKQYADVVAPEILDATEAEAAKCIASGSLASQASATEPSPSKP